ncbi:hypothetical protein HDU87_008624 [Geranomyces variabilis]|uniref:Wings apart-like protein C-terminal domain-containing protein n=1 Tax=Geranomyces variabilis TaxID=109894 RepID=A0AAD5XML8_9FUNG|nr:hypothetical protein HDU87_008624 [Geranomyces variabilis]
MDTPSSSQRKRITTYGRRSTQRASVSAFGAPTPSWQSEGSAPLVSFDAAPPNATPSRAPRHRAVHTPQSPDGDGFAFPADDYVATSAGKGGRRRGKEDGLSNADPVTPARRPRRGPLGKSHSAATTPTKSPQGPAADTRRSPARTAAGKKSADATRKQQATEDIAGPTSADPETPRRKIRRAPDDRLLSRRLDLDGGATEEPDPFAFPSDDPPTPLRAKRPPVRGSPRQTGTSLNADGQRTPVPVAKTPEPSPRASNGMKKRLADSPSPLPVKRSRSGNGLSKPRDNSPALEDGCEPLVSHDFRVMSPLGMHITASPPASLAPTPLVRTLSKTALDDVDQLLARCEPILEPLKLPCMVADCVQSAASSVQSPPQARGRVARMKQSGIPSPSKLRLSQTDNSSLESDASGTSYFELNVSSTLRRSETERRQSAHSTIGLNAPSRRQSLNTIGTFDTEGESSQPSPSIISLATESVPAAAGRPPIGITYAKTRSYLETEDDLFAPKYVAESQRRKDEGLETSDEDEDCIGAKSIHELREAGEASRFTDAMDYIMGGLAEHSPLSILLVMITYIYCGLLHDMRNLEHLILEPHLLDIITKSLLLVPDPLNSHIKSKFERRLILDWKESIADTPFLYDGGKDVKLSDIALQCLLLIARAKPANAAFLQRQLREAGVLEKIIPLSQSGLEAFNDGFQLYIKEPDSALPPLKRAMHITSMCFRILDFATSSCPENGNRVADSAGYLDRALQAMGGATVVSRATESAAQPGADNPLSPTSPTSPELPLSPHSSFAAPPKPVDNFAIMLLATGLLANSVQLNQQNRTRIKEMELSPICPGLSACIPRCICATRISAVRYIATTVNDRLATDSQEMHHAVLTGHTTVLLGLLIDNMPENRAAALACMTDHGLSFEPVVEMLENFTRLYQDVLTVPSTPVTPGAAATSGVGPGPVAANTWAIVAGLVNVFKGRRARQHEIEVLANAYEGITNEDVNTLQLQEVEVQKRKALPAQTIYCAGVADGMGNNGGGGSGAVAEGFGFGLGRRLAAKE